MAILCLANNLMELKEKLGKIVIGYNYDGESVTAHDLKVEGAMTALLKDAIKPNLVQTLENTPAFVHGGPFANIAHGCNSLIATKLALHTSDYVVTEAGFGADLGAEKFFNIKSRLGELKPEAVVLVATVRALKLHGGMSQDNLEKTDLNALAAGLENLEKHLENINKFAVPPVVAINEFTSDTKEELELIKERCQELGVPAVISRVWEQGGAGGTELADKVVSLVDKESDFNYLYSDSIAIKEKIKKIEKSPNYAIFREITAKSTFPRPPGYSDPRR